MTSTNRNTWQRAAIRDLLHRSEDFRTAQQIHDDLRTDGAKVGLATVYRAVQAMAETRELDQIRTPDGETAYRRCSEGHHHHLVCTDCGHTVEIATDLVESWASEQARRHGFTEISHDLELYGRCTNCSAKA